MMNRLFAALMLGFFLSGCGLFSRRKPLFERLPASQTGIDFSNDISRFENDTLNPLDYDYLYNGGGVVAADFNGDGLTDVYFTGNVVSGKLYLNRTKSPFEGGRGMSFTDVTAASGTGTHQWATGATAVDINADGRLDLYVCMAGNSRDPRTKANRFFINQGNDAAGVPHFREMAHEMGLDDTGYSTQAVFLDYDRDGDLDCYVLTNFIENKNRNAIRRKFTQGEHPSTDRLYENVGVRSRESEVRKNSKKQLLTPNSSPGGVPLLTPTFKNVSRQAGITIEGYGLGVAVSDFNGDGWPDIYCANDFITNDLVWVNNRDGTFTNRAAEYFKHTTFNAMGIDVADVNNDALPDVVVVDMLPESNLRQKQMLARWNYDLFALTTEYGYLPQYVRNTLQLHNGNGPDGKPSFSEVGQLAGVYKTDWSWAPLLADFDNDGHRDLLITNGYRREVNNLDYLAEVNNASPFGNVGNRDYDLKMKRETLDGMYKLQEIREHNYLYRNRGEGSVPTFEDVSESWGFSEKTFSNGAAYADFDNDGDLDLAINNLDEVAGLYENTLYRSEAIDSVKTHWLGLKLTGPGANRQALGAKVTVRSGGRMQWAENTFVRGFESSVEPRLHFGLGAACRAETVEIVWPDGRVQTLRNLPADRQHLVSYQPDAVQPGPQKQPAPLLAMVDSGATGLDFRHQEAYFVDFKRTPLLPQQHANAGPGVAVGDVDQNGLDDVYIGNDRAMPRKIFFQCSPGKFEGVTLGAETRDDMGALFFDANADGWPDLYVVSGGTYQDGESPFYQDQLYLNHHGKLEPAPAGTLPKIESSGGCVVAADFDHDGDLDLFRSGRVIPGKYPQAPRSYLLRNDSGRSQEPGVRSQQSGVRSFSAHSSLLTPGSLKFTDITPEALQRPGLVCAALWTDYDNDGWPDLMLAGEWMPLTFFKNEKGHFNHSLTPSLPHSSGWWNSLLAADFDRDGDVDYVAGNHGLNTKYRASPEEPVRVYAADFDHNDRFDPVVSFYLQHREFPVVPRDVLFDQIPGMRNRFPTYKAYAEAEFEAIFSKKELDPALKLTVTQMASCYIENRGGGKFDVRPLPTGAQVSSAFGLLADDVNGDNNPDLILVGNSYAFDTQTGFNDASHGSVLLGDGRGHFRCLTPAQSGLHADRDAKALVRLAVGSEQVYLISNNNAAAQLIQPARRVPLLRLAPMDAAALLHFGDGRTQRMEVPYGAGYLGQSSRVVPLPPGVVSVEVVDFSGKKRSQK